MRRIALIAVSLLTLLLFAGCTGNLFMEWDKPEVPSVSEINNKDVTSSSGANDFLDEVEDWDDSDVLQGDTEKSVATVDKLREIYENGGLDIETRQKAAALAGEIAIESDPNAETLTKKLVGELGNLTDTSTTDTATLLTNLVPEEVRDDEQAFTAMVNTLLNAADSYLIFGDNLDPDDDGVLDYGNDSFMSDGEFGDTVQRAGTSVAIMAAVDVLDSSPGDGIAGADGISALFSIISSDTPTWSDDNPIDYFESNSAYDGMANILEASGLSFS